MRIRQLWNRKYCEYITENKLINPPIRSQAVFCVHITYLHTREILTPSVGLRIFVDEL